MQEMILILDFGSQYTQLIARRVRELSVYCEIHPYHTYPAMDAHIKGVILSGSPFFGQGTVMLPHRIFRRSAGKYLFWVYATVLSTLLSPKEAM